MRIIISVLEACNGLVTLYANKEEIVPCVCLERCASPILTTNILLLLSHVEPKHFCLNLNSSERSLNQRFKCNYLWESEIQKSLVMDRGTKQGRRKTPNKYAI